MLEFYNAKGDETESFPTKRQLELYRLNEPSLSVFQPAIRDVEAPQSPPVGEAGATTPVGSVAPASNAEALPTHA